MTANHDSSVMVRLNLFMMFQSPIHVSHFLLMTRSIALAFTRSRRDFKEFKLRQ